VRLDPIPPRNLAYHWRSPIPSHPGSLGRLDRSPEPVVPLSRQHPARSDSNLNKDFRDVGQL